MYEWRKLTAADHAELVTSRKRAKRPWHSPPHWDQHGPTWFHLTAACFEHREVIGRTPSRIQAFADELLLACGDCPVCAWCVLPNHYHLLLNTPQIRTLARRLGQLHGRSSRCWNLEDAAIGRQIFCRCADRRIRSDRHFWATVNYIHHNPVRHGYVSRWTEWPWSSAQGYLAAVGRDEAARIWRDYPVLDYGDKWDPPDL